MKLPKVYQPSNYEADIYELWQQSGAFRADPKRNAERFSISMPPPNATGDLHVGHALGLTIQDILARQARLQGKDVLWLPGTDHAALATNALMEKRLAEEGTNKHEIGRQAFLDRLQVFVDESRGNIKSQIKAMGASCDWSREHFTLDESLTRAVNETFIAMYRDGLIYRGNRIINWDPKLETTIADDEIERREEKAKFYTFQYGPFQISTARPETKFGDKYVVMHPGDKRYANYKEGDTFEAEWINGPVKATVIKDEAVDPKFGTGVMTITPWHDITDFDIAERHSLDKEQIIDFDGRLLPIAGEFSGLPIEVARSKIVEKLKQKGLLVNIDDNYMHAIAVNGRGKGIIEPQIKLQWFVDVNKKVVAWKGKRQSLKQIMHSVIEESDITIIPPRYQKTYFHWIDNLRDWCISRQIWWGHRIPVWYQVNGASQEIYVGNQPPKGDNWQQDPDTLDTWFSSALWTWSTLLDRDLTRNYDLTIDQILASSIDFQTYHPTTVMETGWDILFFWVARMILATTYMTKEVPFKAVYLHGLVRNGEGVKMSKSDPSTMINPLELIKTYGTDALRLALISGVSPGSDQRLSLPKLTAQRNFCNKLWNVARFIEDKMGSSKVTVSGYEPHSIADDWILSKLEALVKDTQKDIGSFRLAEAYDKLYHFVWDDFADWYVEMSKVEPNLEVLGFSFQTILKLLHPFAPFLTETIWKALPWTQSTLLAQSQFEKVKGGDKQKSQAFEDIKSIVGEVRFISAALGLQKLQLTHQNDEFIEKYQEVIARLGRLGGVNSVRRETNGLRLTGTKHLLWLDIEKSQLQNYLRELSLKEAAQVKVINQLEKRLSDKQYLSNAPAHIVDQTHNLLTEARSLLTNLKTEKTRFSDHS